MNKKRIIEIMNELKEILKEECLAVSHDILFQETCTFYRGEEIRNEINNRKKDLNTSSVSKELKSENNKVTETPTMISESSPSSDTPKKLITEKQMSLLNILAKGLSMDLKITKNWTFKQADMKIKELNNIKNGYMN
jgi:hypothetical protein